MTLDHRAARRAALHRFLCAYVRYADAPERLSLPRREPVPGVRRGGGRVPDRRRAARSPRRSRAGRRSSGIFLAIPALIARVGARRRRSASASVRRGRRQPQVLGAQRRRRRCSAASARSSAGSRSSRAAGCRRACATRAPTAIGYSAQIARVPAARHRPLSRTPTRRRCSHGVERPPRHPVHLVGDADDLRRSRVTVFFRLLLAIPHLVWLALWADRGVLRGDRQLVRDALPRHAAARASTASSRATSATRCTCYAFLYLVANPFPGFTGEPGAYPLDLELPEPARQNRWKTGFRIILAIPGAARERRARRRRSSSPRSSRGSSRSSRGAAPWGLRNLSAYALRYGAQIERVRASR